MPERDESVQKAKIYTRYPNKIMKYTTKYIQR